MYPHERSLVEKYNNRPFALLGVNTDRDLATLRDAIRRNKINWRSWHDGPSGPIARQYRVEGFPTLFLIDHKGVIRVQRVGAANLDADIERLVREAEADAGAR